MATRIAHFTDVHVTEAPGRVPLAALLSKRIAGWLNLRFLGRFAALAGVMPVVRAFLRDLEEVRPDHIVFTGDVTGLSLPSEYEAARAAFEPLLRDERVVGIPGNHDVYVHAAQRDRYFERWFGDWIRTDLAPDDFPQDLRGAYPFPLVRLLGDDGVLFCLRDARPVPLHDSSGHVDPRQLSALDHLLERPDLAGRVRILALHYGLLRADGSPDTYFHRLRNATEVLSLAASADIALVIHGHLHRRFVHPRDSVAPFAIANPGALALEKPGYDRAYHVYTIEDGRIALEARRYDAKAGAFAAWPEAEGGGVIG